MIKDSFKSKQAFQPEFGKFTKLADDIYWAKLPLPFRLDHINIFLIDSIEGLVIIDCGLKNEVTEKLLRLGVDQSEQDNILNYLIKNNYINEERFAIAFTQGKFRIKNWGKVKILIELKRRKIEANLIAIAISQISDLDYQNMFNKLSLKKFNSLNGSLDSRKRKFINYLSYRGWEYDLIIRKVNELF